MDHSVRAYLERIPITKLNSLVESDSFEDTYAVNDAILQDVLEILLSRNTEPGSQFAAYIQKIKQIQSTQKKTDRQIEL